MPPFKKKPCQMLVFAAAVLLVLALSFSTLIVGASASTWLPFLFVGSLCILLTSCGFWLLRNYMLKHVIPTQRAYEAVDAIDEALIFISAEGHVIDVNKAFEEMTGYRRTDIRDTTPNVTLPDNPDFSHWNRVNLLKHWSGEAKVQCRDGSDFPADITLKRVGSKQLGDYSYICVVRNITDKKITEDKLHNLAYYDALTGLPNRSFFLEHLDNAIQYAHRNSQSLALLFIDLDNFKSVNDYHGHETGDRYLSLLAQSYRNRVRSSDCICRLSGDEFTAIIKDVHNEEKVVALANDLLQATLDLNLVDGHEVNSGASIGIALYPRDGMTALELVHQADTAMYQAKQSEDEKICFFSQELELQRRHKRNIEQALVKAMVDDELQLHLQPKMYFAISSESPPAQEQQQGYVEGAEALLRWRYPDDKLINPAEFIPIAEQSDLIVDIGQWVMTTACQKLAEWKDTELGALTLAINLSPRQLRDKKLASQLRQMIKRFDINPKRLQLEITESAVIENIKHSVDTLNGLKALGVTIAMDDFGTGFSSLSYLKLLPFDVIKIDRSFVEGLPEDKDNAIIVNAIISMAEAMNIKVIAEGIETREQLHYLMSLGCQRSQGYYHGKPMPEATFINWLEGQRIKPASENSAAP